MNDLTSKEWRKLIQKGKVIQREQARKKEFAEANFGVTEEEYKQAIDRGSAQAQAEIDAEQERERIRNLPTKEEELQQIEISKQKRLAELVLEKQEQEVLAMKQKNQREMLEIARTERIEKNYSIKNKEEWDKLDREIKAIENEVRITLRKRGKSETEISQIIDGAKEP